MSWIGVESKANNKMIIKSTELLPLDRVADLANLDRVMKSTFNDTMLLEVFCVSHDLMQYFHGSLVEKNDSVDKTNKKLILAWCYYPVFGWIFGWIVMHRIFGWIPDIR